MVVGVVVDVGGNTEVVGDGVGTVGGGVRGGSVPRVGDGVEEVWGVVVDVGGTVEEVRDGVEEAGDCVTRVGDGGRVVSNSTVLESQSCLGS